MNPDYVHRMTEREIQIVAVIIGTLISHSMSDSEAAELGGEILRALRQRDLLTPK